jgi:hypothetical protein
MSKERAMIDNSNYGGILQMSGRKELMINSIMKHYESFIQNKMNQFSTISDLGYDCFPAST